MNPSYAFAQALKVYAAGAWEDPGPTVRVGNPTLPFGSCEELLIEWGPLFYAGELWPQRGTQLTSLGTNCAEVVWGQDFTLTYYQCAPGLDSEGHQPSVDKAAESAEANLDALWALWRHLRATKTIGDRRVVVGGIDPVPQQGNRVGGKVTVTVKITDCP